MSEPGLQIKIDRQLCTGCGSCVAIAPKAFGLDNEFKARVLETAGEESRKKILEAVKTCPVSAISVRR